MASPDSINNHQQPFLVQGRHPVHKIPRRPVPRRDTAHSAHGIGYQPVPLGAPPNVGANARGAERDEPTNWEPARRHVEPQRTLAEKKTFYMVSTGLASESDDPRGNSTAAAAGRDPTWRPQWLRPIVLAAFTAVFLCITIALPVALWYSQRHDGLVKTRQSFGYVWRFGPTAVLTVIAAFWARVELQAMRYMPWIVLRRGLAPDHDLDYPAMLSPQVLYHSLRRRHYLVFWTAITALLIRAEIVLAPGLFRLSPVVVVNPVRIQTADSFALTYAREDLGRENIIAYYAARAIHDFDMAYPYGVTKDAAYQTFGMAEGGGRGTVNAPVTAEVDGFFTDMHCLNLERHTLASIKPFYVYKTIWSTDIALQFEGCGQAVSIHHDNIKPPAMGKFVDFWTVNSTLRPTNRPCPNLPQQYPQTVYFAGKYGRAPGNDSMVQLEPEVSAVLCTPTAWLSKVQVVDDGISPNVTALPNGQSTPVDADILSMLRDSVPYTPGGWSTGTGGVNYGPVRVELSFNETRANDTDLTEPMHNSTVQLMRRMGPLLGHYLLRTEGDGRAAGEMSATVDRLSLNKQVCIAMLTLAFVISCLVAFALVRSRHYTRVWHRDPATILGTLLFINDGTGLQRRIPTFELGGRNKTWSHGEFSPVVLRTWAQVCFTIFVSGLMIGLGVTLQSSRANDGLATVDESGYWYLLWTSFPALIMLGVSVYISSCDTVLRGLSTVHSLCTAPCSSRILDFSMLDMLGLRAMLKSARQKLWTITMSQIAVLACGSLATLATVLFSVKTVPKSTTMELQQTSWFGNTRLGDTVVYQQNREKLRSLLARKGESNYTYPRNTYDDMAFPTIDFSQLAGTADTTGNTRITVTAPATKIVSRCESVPADKFNVTITHYTEPNGQNTSETVYQGPVRYNGTCPDGRPLSLGQLFEFGRNQTGSQVGHSYFTNILSSTENIFTTNRRCGDAIDTLDGLLEPQLTQTYTWGRFSHAKADIDFVRYWKCRYTWAQLQADVDLVWRDGELVIDQNSPPRPDPSTTRPLDAPLNVPFYDYRVVAAGLSQTSIYGSAMPEIFVSDPSVGNMQEFFRPLIRPYGSIPLEAFGDPAWEDRILRGLDSLLAFTSAQLLNLENRLAVGESSSSTAAAAPPAVRAVVTDAGRRRLVQNATVTSVVIGILGLVALVNLWALASRALRQFGLVGPSGTLAGLLSMNVKGLAPDEFGSINAMASLLRDSNAVAHLPADSRRFTASELHGGALAGLMFRLGWFRREVSRTRHFTVGALGDKEFTFLHSKEELETAERAPYRRVSDTSEETAYEGGGRGVVGEGDWI